MTTFTLFTATTSGLASNTHYPNKATITDAAALEAAAWFDHVAAEYQGNQRSTHGFVTSNCLVMDIDNDHSENPDEWVTPQMLADLLADVEFMTATSRNHNTSKHGTPARPRFHVYLPISPVADPGTYAGLKKSLADRFDFFDAGALDAARFLYGHPTPQVETFTGTLLVDEWLTRQAEADAFAAFDAATLAIGEGSRNATLSRFAGRVLIRYGDTEQARNLFDRKAALCDPPLPEAEVEAIWRSALRFAGRVASTPGYVSPETYEKKILETGKVLEPHDYTDVGQATVLAKLGSKRVRHTPGLGWLVYRGGVWEASDIHARGVVHDLTDRQLEYAFARLSQAKAAEEQAGDDKLATEAAQEQVKAAQGFLKFVDTRRSSPKITACLKEAEPMLAVEINELDTGWALLNTPSATIDLATGQSRPHDPADLITHQTAINPSDQGADIWQACLEKTFGGDQELIDYVQRICGLSLLGKVYLEALIVAYGPGGNGKSTFWNTVYRTLGSYAGKISAKTLTAGNKDSVKAEMAELKGRRFIIASELEEGSRLSTATLKHLCSTDEIFAEKKYKDPFSYTPSHTLVLYTNHLPKVGALDEGTWRRLLVIPFDHKISESQDIKNYADYLYEHAGGAALAWMIQGAKLTISEQYALPKPAAVTAAIEHYRSENDWLSAFLEECCEIEVSAVERSGALIAEYQAWCRRTGNFARSSGEFVGTLERAGYTRKRKPNGVFISGLKLNSEFSQP